MSVGCPVSWDYVDGSTLYIRITASGWDVQPTPTYQVTGTKFGPWCRHGWRTTARVGKRHAQVLCLDCGDVLVRVRVDPPSAPVVVRAEPPATDIPRAPVVLRMATERRHRPSHRRFRTRSWGVR